MEAWNGRRESSLQRSRQVEQRLCRVRVFGHPPRLSQAGGSQRDEQVGKQANYRLFKFAPGVPPFLPAGTSGGVLLKRRGQRIRIFRLEEHQVARLLSVPFERVVHAVLSRHPLKGADVAVRDLDVRHALPLTDQFSDRLPARGRGFGFLPAMGQILGDRAFQRPACHLGGVDDQRHRPMVDIFLHGFLLSVLNPSIHPSKPATARNSQHAAEAAG